MALLATANWLPTAFADAPALSLVKAKDRITVRREARRQPATIDPGVYLAASGGPLELRISRLDYDHPLELNQVIHTDAGTEVRPLPADALDQAAGLKDFFKVDIRNSKGIVVSSASLPFCPGGFDKQRLNDSGPQVPDYPTFCSLNPFMKATVWGLEEGWAVNAVGFEGVALRGPDGRYQMTVSVAPSYVSLLEIAPESASTSVQVRLRTAKCRHHCGGPIVSPRRATGVEEKAGTPTPTLTDPDPSILPDLIALPSWGISVARRGSRDFLTFGANVWTGGASSLVVEGFRRPNSDTMDAYQYFYKDGEVVGRSATGTLEYDRRRGHQHWHFQQFVAYRLLSADQSEAVKSRKEAFCLAATDPIDLSLPGADWNAETGLTTACGTSNSIWVRETLPIGWGDTYFRGLPGQSFNITDLPNGTYYIEVHANPLGLLHEQDTANNIQLREVILKGKPGNRSVEVPPWHGIDTEGSIPYE
jgi:lysyl oxidase